MILVTGATGTVGKELVQRLIDMGQPVRVFTRDASKAAHLGGQVEVAVGNFDNPDALRAAMNGVARIFLVTSETRQDLNALETAKRAGVEQIVKLSTLEASEHILQVGKWHYEREELIRGSGLAWSLIRPGMFMTNTITWWAASIKQQGAVYFPGGKGQVAPIDPHDVAAVAAVALTRPGHTGQAYELTGPQLLSVGEMVQVIAKVLGKPIQYTDIPLSAAKEWMLQSGMNEALAAAFAEMLTALYQNQGAQLTDTVEQVTGQPARTFESWCRAHIAAFQ
ncbi:MAG: SDR family oxidoreductase [Chloroflexi bacterium]|nr:SDR family oxidoreductase [Chloroflexota bacterium]